MKILVIVESPAKCKTISKYLAQLKDGHIYKVMASVGHIRDLRKKELGIDVEHHFKPDYVVLEDKDKTILGLTDAASKHDHVLLATDQDREGESIAWHLQKVLQLGQRDYDRITFNEITPQALQSAIARPRKIDMKLVQAQQTRRILDRLVGFKLSPLLWKAFDTRGILKLSAGRVQSAAMKMIVDRESLVREHVSAPYWTMQGEFQVGHDSKFEDAKLYSKGTVARFDRAEDAMQLLNTLTNRFMIVSDGVSLKKVREKPAAPFTTSTLQQEASSKLSFPIKRTMMLAQQLYEAGKITYMRTDSTHISDDALKQIVKQIKNRFGDGLVHPGGRSYDGKKSKGAQEAHEAIRPTTVADYPLATEDSKVLTKDHKQLYDLIWKRTIASQMTDTLYHELAASIVDESFGPKDDMHFKGRVRTLIEAGYLLAYGEATVPTRDFAAQLYHELIKEGKDVPVSCTQVFARNTWTGPPARFSESTLIKALEKEGVGRPSTYVSILTKLYEKQYVVKQNVAGTRLKMTHFMWTPATRKNKTGGRGKIEEQHIEDEVHGEVGKLVPTETGLHIDAFLRQHFLDIVDSSFTASMEEQLDAVADGEQKDLDVLNTFWKNFTAKMDAYEQFRTSLKKKTKQPKGAVLTQPHETTASGKIKLEQSKQTFNIRGENYIVRLAMYGPVIQKEDRYWNLKPFLAAKKKGYMDMAEQDVQFVIGFPYALPKGAELHIGPYGPYIKKNGENYKIPREIMKAHGYKLEELPGLTSQEMEAVFKSKAEYLLSQKTEAGSKKSQRRQPVGKSLK